MLVRCSRLIGRAVLTECKGNSGGFQGTEESNYPGIRAVAISVHELRVRKKSSNSPNEEKKNVSVLEPLRVLLGQEKMLKTLAEEKASCPSSLFPERLINVPQRSTASMNTDGKMKSLFATAVVPRARIKSITHLVVFHVLRSLRFCSLNYFTLGNPDRERESTTRLTHFYWSCSFHCIFLTFCSFYCLLLYPPFGWEHWL